MVEFGLKLEDNKVAEWTDKYIAYEKLKAILNKAKNSIKKKDELMKRNPDWAKQIIVAYDEGKYAFISRHNSYSDLFTLMGGENTPAKKFPYGAESISTDSKANGKHDEKLVQKEQQDVSETKPLMASSAAVSAAVPALRRILSDNQISSRDSALGTYTEIEDPTSAPPPPPSASKSPYNSFDRYPYEFQRSNSIVSNISDASSSNILKGLSDYFSSSKNYELRLRSTLKEIDYMHEKFDNQLNEELDKVNKFYDEKMQELTQQVDFLVESVTSSELFKVSKMKRGRSDTSDDDHLDVSGGDYRDKQKSSLAQIVASIRRVGSSNAGDGHHEKGLATTEDYELMNEDDYDEDDDKEELMIAQTGSEDSLLDIPLSSLERDMALTPRSLHRKAIQKKVRKEEEKIRLSAKKKESDSIKRAIIDQYRRVKLLHNFAILNYTGFVKIIKKHDKTFKSDYKKKGIFKQISIDPTVVCKEGLDASSLTKRMENLFAKWFCNGNVREAHVQMLPKKDDGLQMDWSQLRLGYRLGMCSIITLWVCWDCIWGLVKDGYTTIGGRTAFPVFRSCGGLLLLHWCWGVSVYVWSRYRINYIYLFDFNPNVVDSPLAIFNDVVDETLIYSILMLLYYKSGAHDIPDIVVPGIYPFILVVFTVKSLVFPWKTRSLMWNGVWEVITAPYHSPTFYTVYIGDVLTSLVKVFQDVAWTFGFIISGDFLESENNPDFMHKHDKNSHYSIHEQHAWSSSFWYKNVLIPLLCLLPLWFRFNQCLRKYMDTKKRWPNLANAIKYATSQTVTLFGAFHPLYLIQNGGYASNVNVVGNLNWFQTFWMTLFVVSSLYSFMWDVYMDWGLGQIQYNFLGPRLMFPSRSYYYGVIAVDLILRSMWVLSLIPPSSGAKFEIPQYLTAVTMSLEILRRTVWAFFRLENEHRSNTDQFRRVNFVPLHFNTGHVHKYKHEKEHVGWRVLAEVCLVSLLVIGISAFSVIAAQRASSQYNTSSSSGIDHHHGHRVLYDGGSFYLNNDL